MARPVLERVKQLFPTELLQAKKEKRTGETVFGGDEKDDEDDVEPRKKKIKSDDLELSTSTVTEVGSTSPVEDFHYLLTHRVTTGMSLDSVGQQMEGVISRLMASSFGTDMNTKILASLVAYRAACVEENRPGLYNDYIRLGLSVS